jgi:hypothetical protein
MEGADAGHVKHKFTPLGSCHAARRNVACAWHVYDCSRTSARCRSVPSPAPAGSNSSLTQQLHYPAPVTGMHKLAVADACYASPR